MAKRHRSSKTGKLVSAKYAKRHKATTVAEKARKRHVLGVGYLDFNSLGTLLWLSERAGTDIFFRLSTIDRNKKGRLIWEEL